MEDIAGGGERRESNPARYGVKAGVKAVLAARRAFVRDKELTLALTYLKGREQW